MGEFIKRYRKTPIASFLAKLSQPQVESLIAQHTKNRNGTTIFSGETDSGLYTIVDMVYEGRPARVLFSGNRVAAQSGVAKDDNLDLLFDYCQRIRELAESVKPKTVLVIGGGALTIPMALLKDSLTVQVDVVEPDTKLPAIAQRYFNYRPSKRLRIIHDEGFHFLSHSSSLYDLIIVDAFVHTDVPLSLASAAAVKQFAAHLSRRGTVAINIISSYYGRNAAFIAEQFSLYSSVFSSVRIYPANRGEISLWVSQNFILVGQKGRKRKLHIRFEALESPGLSGSDNLNPSE